MGLVLPGFFAVLVTAMLLPVLVLEYSLSTVRHRTESARLDWARADHAVFLDAYRDPSASTTLARVATRQARWLTNRPPVGVQGVALGPSVSVLRCAAFAGRVVPAVDDLDLPPAPPHHQARDGLWVLQGLAGTQLHLEDSWTWQGPEPGTPALEGLYQEGILRAWPGFVALAAARPPARLAAPSLPDARWLPDCYRARVLRVPPTGLEYAWTAVLTDPTPPLVAVEYRQRGYDEDPATLPHAPQYSPFPRTVYPGVPEHRAPITLRTPEDPDYEPGSVPAHDRHPAFRRRASGGVAWSEPVDAPCDRHSSVPLPTFPASSLDPAPFDGAFDSADLLPAAWASPCPSPSPAALDVAVLARLASYVYANNHWSGVHYAGTGRDYGVDVPGRPLSAFSAVDRAGGAEALRVRADVSLDSFVRPDYEGACDPNSTLAQCAPGRETGRPAPDDVRRFYASNGYVDARVELPLPVRSFASCRAARPAFPPSVTPAVEAVLPDSVQQELYDDLCAVFRP